MKVPKFPRFSPGHLGLSLFNTKAVTVTNHAWKKQNFVNLPHIETAGKYSKWSVFITFTNWLVEYFNYNLKYLKFWKESANQLFRARLQSIFISIKSLKWTPWHLGLVAIIWISTRSTLRSEAAHLGILADILFLIPRGTYGI